MRRLDAEQAERPARSLSYQMKVARFPQQRDLGGFDWREPPLPAARSEPLARGG